VKFVPVFIIFIHFIEQPKIIISLYEGVKIRVCASEWMCNSYFRNCFDGFLVEHQLQKISCFFQDILYSWKFKILRDKTLINL